MAILCDNIVNYHRVDLPTVSGLSLLKDNHTPKLLFTSSQSLYCVIWLINTMVTFKLKITYDHITSNGGVGLNVEIFISNSCQGTITYPLWFKRLYDLVGLSQQLLQVNIL